ncbi:uncharacterized protein TRUGW13939_01865 [Talaromyces rugulosus]|uniref:Aflatoxin regulatory protein domain-containing protein n=1 Tax=Talaromyces rugulosus TaxID=121627 RepID=A0A7H8QLK0_TALRU|nr:uncharacterized protein TRUGW13939_01865 [Talaromyces rugulosus]QKX54776.1 hypothetical protein TRUGW13939_01865 [Talaromyces rugulosus]
MLNYDQQHETANLPLSWPSSDVFNANIDISGFTNWDVMDLAPTTTSPPIQASTHRNTTPRRSELMDGLDPISDTRITHDCEARAISILSSMQHGEMRQGLMSCSTDPAHAYADLDLTPSFDRVLSINKAALNSWSKLMKCSCAQCPHLILIYVSILSKMLFWYRIAAIEKRPTLGGGTESDDSTQNSDINIITRSSSKEAPTVDKFSVHPTTIQIGMLSLDAEDEANLRRALLLRELHRTEHAIHEFMNVDRRNIEKNADEAVQRTVQWSLAGIPQLIEELQDVIQTVKQTK